MIVVKLLVGNTWNLLRQKGRRETKFYFVKLAIHQRREHVSVNDIIPHFSKQTDPLQNVKERNSQQTWNNSRNNLGSPSMLYPIPTISRSSVGRWHKHAQVDTYPGWDLTQKFTHSVRSSVIAQARLTRCGCATSHGCWFCRCWWCWVYCGIPWHQLIGEDTVGFCTSGIGRLANHSRIIDHQCGKYETNKEGQCTAGTDQGSLFLLPSMSGGFSFLRPLIQASKQTHEQTSKEATKRASKTVWIPNCCTYNSDEARLSPKF